MRLVDQLQLGPFSAKYHRTLVNEEFAAALQRFLDRNLLPQADATIHDADGTLTATFDNDRYCHPSSLVRDIFTLDVVLHADNGTSELKADITFDHESRSFSVRKGHDHYFYLWTPSRKAAREEEMASIRSFVNDIQRGNPIVPQCPICGSEVTIVNDSMVFDVRCRGRRCFQCNYHKDENGDLLHGHFFTTHPVAR